jgi:hypothetical protein
MRAKWIIRMKMAVIVTARSAMIPRNGLDSAKQHKDPRPRGVMSIKEQWPIGF